MNPIAVQVLTVVLVVLLGIVSPLLSRREIGNVIRRIRAGEAGVREKLYERIIVQEWVAVIVLLAAWALLGGTLGEIGLHFEPSGLQWVAVLASLALAAFVVWHSVRTAATPGSRAAVREQLGPLEAFVPHSRDDLEMFGWLSFTAGICEEIVYRGILLTLFAGIVGLWPAVVLSSLVFGLGHAYQGIGGILRTGGVGLVAALVVVTTGSVYPAIVLHIVVDLAQGRMTYTVVNEEDADQEPIAA